MWFSIVALLTVAFSAADAAETYSIRPGQVDGVKHILMAPLKRFCDEASSCRVQLGALGIAVH